MYRNNAEVSPTSPQQNVTASTTSDPFYDRFPWFRLLGRSVHCSGSNSSSSSSSSDGVVVVSDSRESVLAWWSDWYKLIIATLLREVWMSHDSFTSKYKQWNNQSYVVWIWINNWHAPLCCCCWRQGRCHTCTMPYLYDAYLYDAYL